MSSLEGEVQAINREQKLRSDAMKGKWSELFETCKEERALWTAKITGTEDTVLHMAVSCGETKVVGNMIEFLVKQEESPAQNNVAVTVNEDGEERWNVSTVLRAENDRRNTPLHLAAIRGDVELCKKMGHKDPSLIARRNIAGETPLFLAALNGEKEAFLWLHYLCVGSYEVSSTDFVQCIRNNDDDTILHCAIAEGHTDVAIEIVHLYRDHLKEMMKRNKKGLSPLHLLAANRSAFKSTALLELPILAPPIYWFSVVGEKNEATSLEELQASWQSKYGLSDGSSEEPRKDEKKKSATWVERLKSIINIALVLPTWLPILILAASISFLALLVLLTFSEAAIRRWFRLFSIPEMKKAHTRWHQIMTKLLQHASEEDMSQVISRNPSEQLSISLQTEDNELEPMTTPASGKISIDTPLMIATKNGVIEMMETILELFPSMIKDLNAEGKNIFLLAVEYRQTNAYRFLLKQRWLEESLFRQVDKEGNNALHLVSDLEVNPNGDIVEVIDMESELEGWLNLVEMSLPRGLWSRFNRKMETPGDMLRKSQEERMKIKQEWAARTSNACSVVSTLVVSVAFATRTSIPGDYDDKGYAILRNKPQAFKIFKDSSFVALFFALISTVCFLSIVASPSRQYFHTERFIPSRFYYGLYFMFASIVCLWISFCAADFFLLDDNSQKLHKAFLTYILLSSGFTLMVVLQLPIFLRQKFFGIFSTPSPRIAPISPIQYRRTKI